jgi:hypothetical protein
LDISSIANYTSIYDFEVNNCMKTLREMMDLVESAQAGVAEGANDTVYPGAEVIKSKNGKPVGEIYQDGNSWGCFHYKADRGYEFIDSREDAIEALKDLHQETGRSRPDYTIKGVAEEQLEETSPEAIAKIDQITRK